MAWAWQLTWPSRGGAWRAGGSGATRQENAYPLGGLGASMSGCTRTGLQRSEGSFACS